MRVGEPEDGFIDAIEIDLETLIQSGFGQVQRVLEIGVPGWAGEEDAQFFAGQSWRKIRHRLSGRQSL